MILAYPLLLAATVALAWQRRHTAGGRGRAWMTAWIAAGFLMSFSLVTGLSIGLFILPFAAVTVIWVATRSPHLLEATGFLVGIAATAALVAGLTA